MSWSVSANGTPGNAKDELKPQFERAKAATGHIPMEQETVGVIEDLVNSQLDSLSQDETPLTVTVSAYGSAYRGMSEAGCSASYTLAANK